MVAQHRVVQKSKHDHAASMNIVTKIPIPTCPPKVAQQSSVPPSSTSFMEKMKSCGTARRNDAAHAERSRRVSRRS